MTTFFDRISDYSDMVITRESKNTPSEHLSMRNEKTFSESYTLVCMSTKRTLCDVRIYGAKKNRVCMWLGNDVYQASTNGYGYDFVAECVSRVFYKAGFRRKGESLINSRQDAPYLMRKACEAMGIDVSNTLCVHAHG